MEGSELSALGIIEQARRLIEGGAANGPEELDAIEELGHAIRVHRPGQSRPWPMARAIPDIDDPLPDALLAARGLGGAVLSAGEVCIITGAGGVGKSMLTGSTALGYAMAPVTGRHTLPGRIFDGQGGPVLLAVYEDRPAVISRRLRNLAGEWRRRADAGLLGDYAAADVHRGLRQVFVADMRGWPLYGLPADDPLARQSVHLDGMTALETAAGQCGARLVIIDPALSAFTGESNAAPPVRSFLAELGLLAERTNAGVLVVAHSTKSARVGGDPYDPGQVGGSGAWADGCRGVLTLTTQRTKGKDDDGGTWPLLAISKANWGPAYRALPLNEIEYQASSGRYEPIGYEAGAPEWQGGAPAPSDGQNPADRTGKAIMSDYRTRSPQEATNEHQPEPSKFEG